MSALFLVLLLMPAAAGSVPGLAAAWKKEFCFLCWG